LLKANFSQISPLKRIDILLLVLALCLAGKYLVVNHRKSQADDFAPIYVAAKLMADGKSASIYEHHPYLFHIVPPGEFKEAAEKIGFKGFLHPYVHLPLVSLLLRPLLFIPYHIMTKLLLLMNFLSFMLSLHLILKLIGRELNLRWLSIAILAVCYFYPLRYGLWLGQTSPLIFLGITAVYYLANVGHLKTSGGILGGIISLKITPLLLLPYFLIKKKWSLVLSSLITVVVIGIGSIVLAGGESNLAFFQNLIRLSGLSLASWNNQSLDGFLLRWSTYASHIYDWHLLELSFKMKLIKFVILSSMLLLWLIILLRPTNPNEKNRDLIDFSFTLILLSIFTPISWSHYLLFLVFPYIVLLSTLIQNKTIPYRKSMIGGLILSYPGVALPPPYLLALVDFPLISEVSLPVLSSLSFLGGIVLIIIILSYTIFTRKTSRKLEHTSR
jgi:hypothetical protein